MSQELLLKIIEVVIAVCILVTTKYIVPVLKNKGYYHALVNVMAWARELVPYVEAAIVGTKMGQERMEKAKSMLKLKAAELGLTLTEEDVQALIQSAYDDIIGGSDTN